MKTTKTLNIEASLHTELKIRSAGAGIPLGEFVEIVLQVGLSHPEEIRQLSVTRTTQEPEPGPER